MSVGAGRMGRMTAAASHAPATAADYSWIRASPSLFALAERLTGVRVTEELLRDAAYVTGEVRAEP